MIQRTESRWAEIGAGAVHLYTASGAVLAFLIVMFAIQGDALQALWLGWIAVIIDGTDGALARKFRVRETLPWFDGARLDDIVDYLTYVFAPVLLLWTGGYLPEGTTGLVLAALPLLASSYQFCRVDAKTEDHFFLGFPSYWNIVAFYTVVFGLSQTTLAIILIVCSALVFVPIRYLYPSRTALFRPLNVLVSALWTLSYALMLMQMPNPNPLLRAFSILCVVYYLGMSFFITYRIYKQGHA